MGKNSFPTPAFDLASDPIAHYLPIDDANDFSPQKAPQNFITQPEVE